MHAPTAYQAHPVRAAAQVQILVLQPLLKLLPGHAVFAFSAQLTHGQQRLYAAVTAATRPAENQRGAQEQRTGDIVSLGTSCTPGISTLGFQLEGLVT